MLHADARIKETLKDTGAGQADAVVTTTDQDATDIMTCLLAKELEIPSVMSVVHTLGHVGLSRRIGVNTMENPQRLIAEYLYRAVARPAIVDCMRIGEEAEVFEITVAEGGPTPGKRLIEATDAELIPSDVLIVVLEREGENSPITPRGESEILQVE